MARRASSPRLPSAASWKRASVRLKQRPTTAMNRSFFVPKSRKTYGCEMPARRATSSVEEPCRPSSAKTANAASRISSRRCSFVFRSVVTTAVMLVMTHYIVKSLRHPVEIVVGEPGVEGQGERPLEDPLRPGEGALVAVGPEQVQRIGADLDLDSPLPERRQHPVPIVDLDHVGLPAVHVALVGRRQLHREVAEPLGVSGRDARPLGEQLVEPPGLRDADGTEDVREAGGETRSPHGGRDERA